MPTRCNRGFYCRSYCLFNMFRAPLCPSSGAQEYYTVVAGCGSWCCGFQVAGLVWSWGLCAPVCRMLQNILQTGHITLMMGIVVPETCWASNKICNKNLCCNYLAFYFHIFGTRFTDGCLFIWGALLGTWGGGVRLPGNLKISWRKILAKEHLSL